MIYTSEHYSTAMLEKLVHANAILPPGQHYVRITIPAGTTYEVFQPERHPGWDGADESICRAAGDAWRTAGRAALFLVSSIPARIERNILIHPDHPDTARITHDLPQPVWWDERLFGHTV